MNPREEREMGKIMQGLKKAADMMRPSVEKALSPPPGPPTQQQIEQGKRFLMYQTLPTAILQAAKDIKAAVQKKGEDKRK